jgi:hypothetical protein
MARSRQDSSPKREIHGALSYDFTRDRTVEPHRSRVPASLLLAVHLAQTAVAGLFGWVCSRAYHGALSPQMEAWWTVCLVSLALAWMGALPIFAWLWRFAPPIEARLSFWASYWLGVLALPISILAIAVTSLRRLSPGLVKRSPTPASLLVGVVTTWPLMQAAAYLACDKALRATLMEEASLSPYWSFVFVYGTCLALPLALTTSALLVRRKRLAQATSARGVTAGSESLMPGEATVSGVVELAEGETRAVRLEIDQHGTEQESSGTWSHTWTETGRRLTVHPFYLRTRTGQRVRVLAGDQARLMDALDGKILVNRTERTCSAELTSGETVSAFGQLSRGRDPEAAPEAGYRSAAIGWVLLPPDGGKMLLSSYPIDRPFHERAFRILWFVVVLLALVVAGQSAFVGYHLRASLGQPLAASVKEAKIVEEKTDDGVEVKRMVTVTLPITGTERDRTVTREVTRESYPSATPQRTIAVLREPVFSTMNFGEHPTAPFWVVFAVCAIALMCLFVGDGDRPDARWYLEQKVVDNGSGRLPDAGPTTDKNVAEIRELVDQAFGRKS